VTVKQGANVLNSQQLSFSLFTENRVKMQVSGNANFLLYLKSSLDLRFTQKIKVTAWKEVNSGAKIMQIAPYHGR